MHCSSTRQHRVLRGRRVVRRPASASGSWSSSIRARTARATATRPRRGSRAPGRGSAARGGRCRAASPGRSARARSGRVNVLSRAQPPNRLTVPPGAAIATASSHASGRPTASTTRSAPRPSVSSRTRSTSAGPRVARDGLGGAEAARGGEPLGVRVEHDRRGAGGGDQRAQHQPERAGAEDRGAVAGCERDDVERVDGARERLGERGGAAGRARRAAGAGCARRSARGRAAAPRTRRAGRAGPRTGSRARARTGGRRRTAPSCRRTRRRPARRCVTPSPTASTTPANSCPSRDG